MYLKGEIDDLVLDNPETCPNCGQYVGDEATCPNCGAVVFNENDGFSPFEEDDGENQDF